MTNRRIYMTSTIKRQPKFPQQQQNCNEILVIFWWMNMYNIIFRYCNIIKTKKQKTLLDMLTERGAAAIAITTKKLYQ